MPRQNKQSLKHYMCCFTSHMWVDCISMCFNSFRFLLRCTFRIKTTTKNDVVWKRFFFFPFPTLFFPFIYLSFHAVYSFFRFFCYIFLIVFLVFRFFSSSEHYKRHIYHVRKCAIQNIWIAQGKIFRMIETKTELNIWQVARHSN